MALVEFAIVSTLLFAILFGIIDFGWAFTRSLDVRHGAREIGRLTVVNFNGGLPAGASQAQRIVNEGCDRMDGDSSTTVTLDLSADSQSVKISVSQAFDTLTGFYDSFMPSTIDSSVTMRVEQTPSWTADANPHSYVCGGGV